MAITESIDRGGRSGARPAVISAIFVLLLILGGELALSARQQSQTSDEACHIFAGYRYWKYLDFGFNSEHPPLVKLLAALPLLRFAKQIPEVPDGDLHLVEFVSGRQFVYSNDADQILFRSRMAVSLITLGLGLLISIVGNRMFGTGSALLALTLFVFEPNVLANGALVTTDMGVTCFLFLAVYLFYLYVCQPSAPRLIGVGIAAGLTLAAKHSGILVFPILAILAFTEIWRGQPLAALNSSIDESYENRRKRAIQLAGAFCIIGLVAVAVLWSFYDFRFQARPAGLTLNPPFSEYAGKPHYHPGASRVVMEIERLRLLPEAYVYGFASVGKLFNNTPTFIFGKIYPHGEWFYFPGAVLIKSTLAFLTLFLLVPFSRELRGRKYRREVAFLAIPPVIYFLVAMVSSVNLGLRHVLPIYPFLLVLIGAAAWKFSKQSRPWAFGIAALVVFHIASSMHSFPNYLTYSNELFGGPANTYKVLSDSNVDWGQGLKLMKRYIDEHRIRSCWFAYYMLGAADPGYYDIPCKMLPTSLSGSYSISVQPVSQAISGPVFLSTSELTGRFWGPGDLNPYLQFMKVRPTALIGNSILVFDGSFEIPLASAISHQREAIRLEKN
jgi:4-amino-4-deoxy-L-arabinose transferase-like glycosyltransferase